MSSREGYTTKEADKIPEDWKIVKLGDDEENVAEIIMGQSPPSSTYNDSGKGLPFLQGNADFGYIYPKPAIYTSNPIKIARKNDILISVRAPVGEVNLSPFKCCIGRGLSAIRTKPSKMLYLFAFYYIKYSVRRLAALATGSTFTAVRKKDLEHFNLVIPPIPEQDKIASILSTVDEAIQKTDKVITKAEMLKRGLMQNLLTEGIGHREFQETEIGRIPKEWKIEELGEIAKVTVGYVGRISKYYTTQENGVPLLSTTNISKNGIKLENLKYVTQKFYDKNKKVQISPGDILIARHGESGSAAVIPKEIEKACCLNVVIVRKSKKIIPEFVEYLFNFQRTRMRLVGWKSGAVQGVINTKVLEKFKITLPSFEEQQKIASILLTVDEMLALERNRKKKLESVKRGLMNDLFTGKVRVKVD